MELFRKFHELSKAAAQPRFPALERCSHLPDIVFEIQNRAIIEEAAPLRIKTNHFQVVAHGAPGLAKDTPQHRRLNQNGGAHVEAKTLFFQHSGFAAQPGIFLEDFDLVAARGQSAGRRKASQS